MDKFVKIFKALGEPSRLKILRFLSHRAMYVCEMEAVLNMSQPRISQHLRVLKEAGLLKEIREGQRIFYSLDMEVLEGTVGEFLEFLKADLLSLPLFVEECSRLQEVDQDSRVLLCRGGAKPLEKNSRLKEQHD